VLISAQSDIPPTSCACFKILGQIYIVKMAIFDQFYLHRKEWSYRDFKDLTTCLQRWSPPSHHLATTWPPPGHHLATTWPPAGHHLASTWSAPGHHLAITWHLHRSLSVAMVTVMVRPCSWITDPDWISLFLSPQWSQEKLIRMTSL